MIDKIYQVLLNILNKENNGYISPAVFNTLARQVQEEIFLNYFGDENRSKNRSNKNLVNRGYSNSVRNVQDKLAVFTTNDNIALTSGIGDLPADLYHVEDSGILTVDNNVAHFIERAKLNYVANSEMAPTTDFPRYSIVGSKIHLFPSTISSVDIDYIRRPSNPNWTYTVVSGKEMYNPSSVSHQDFDLHIGEFSNIVIKMAAYSGVTIREAEVVQAASAQSDKQYIKDNQ